MFVCAIFNPVWVCLPVFMHCVVASPCHVCDCAFTVCFFFVVCLSVVAQRAHVVYLRVCIVLCDTHTHSAGRGASWFRCPSLTCSVQDFLQDVATKPVPDSSVSPSLLPSPFASSSVSLSFEKERERERQSASNLTCSLAVLLWVLTPLCVDAGRQVPLKEKHKLNS